MSVIVVQSIYNFSEYYVFRPISNENYREIKFHIKNGQIIEDKFNKLKFTERVFIQDKLL